MTTHSAAGSDIDRVMAIADQISGNRSKSMQWLRTGLKAFDNETPETLVAEARTRT